MWILFASLSAVTAALVAIFGKLGLSENISPTIATTVRSIIMAVFLVTTVGVLVSIKKLDGFSLSAFGARDWLLIILSGVFGALSWLFYFVALKQGPASSVAAVDRLSVVFVVLLAAVFLGESLGWKAFLGAGIMILGAFLITLK